MIKWGFIGCGNVVEKKSGPAFSNAQDGAIQAIMRRNLSDAKRSAFQLGAPSYYDRVEALVNDDRVDAVYIATPPGLHYEQASICCEAGKPVYIEKPFARNHTEAEKLVVKFAAKGIPLFVGHYRRALPKFIYIRELIHSGSVGTAVNVDFYLCRKFDGEHPWLYNPELSGGGKFFDIAPHFIDALIFFFGQIEVENALVTCHNAFHVEDIVDFVFKSGSGVIGTANVNTISTGKHDRMRIWGTDGLIEFSVHGNDDVMIENASGIQTVHFPEPEFVEQPMIQMVVDELMGRGQCPCSGEEALKTVRIIDDILEHHYNGRKDEFWKRTYTWNWKA